MNANQPKTHPSHLSHPSHPSHFSDTEFFRRLVADRAQTLRAEFDLLNVKNALIGMPHSLFRSDPASVQIEILIHIAALCERAAVDITIPNSRKTQTGRDRARLAKTSARSAPKKGKSK